MRNSKAVKIESTGTIVKKTIFIILYAISALVFGHACGQVQSKYLSIIMLGPETLNIGIILLASLVALSVFTGLVALLVRPLWLTASAFAVGTFAILFFTGFYTATMITGLLFLIFSYSYASSIHKKFANQIKFSSEPFFTTQNLLLVSTVLLVSASFAVGYAKDSAQRNFLVPTEIIQEATKSLLKQTEETTKESGLAPAELAKGMENAKLELDKMWTDLETQLKPYSEYVPIFLGAIVFITMQSILIFFIWIPPLLLAGVIPLLKLLGVTTVVTETKAISRLTL